MRRALGAGEVSPITPSLGEVQETLLIPLYGRAIDARARRSILSDQRARELVDSIDYDFGRFRGTALSGAVLRTSIVDGWVRQFIDAHPDGTVVELGAGLNTRFDRVDNGHVHWFDLDLPDVIALRRQLFQDSERSTMVAGSITDTDWYHAILDSAAPYFFVCEAVLVYLSEPRVHATLRQLARCFAGSRIVADTADERMLRNQRSYKSMNAVSARMQWACPDPEELAPFGLRRLETRTFASPPPPVAAAWPWRYRYGMPVLARVAPHLVNSYKLNLFEFDPAGDEPRPG